METSEWILTNLLTVVNRDLARNQLSAEKKEELAEYSYGIFAAPLANLQAGRVWPYVGWTA